MGATFYTSLETQTDILNSKTTTATILTLILSLLVLEQLVYRAKKAHLPGAKWTIPVIGKFADSLNPTLANYKAQWNSGPLSAVSVFNMYVLIIKQCTEKSTDSRKQFHRHRFFQRNGQEDPQLPQPR